MNKMRNLISVLLGLVALAGLAGGLAWLLGPQGMLQGQQMSPLQTPTPLPGGLSLPPTPGGEYPWPALEGTPDATAGGKREAILNAPPYTPGPTKEVELYPIRTLDDVVTIALEDSFIQSRLGSECRKGSVAGTPIFVKYIGDAEGDWGYYLVPFYKENYIVLTAIVGTMGDRGASAGTIAEGSCNSEAVAARAAEPRETPQNCLHVSADEATRLVEEQGYKIEKEPELVFRSLREGADEFDPFWEFRTIDGEILYVIHRGRDTRVYRADDVHPNR